MPTAAEVIQAAREREARKNAPKAPVATPDATPAPVANNDGLRAFAETLKPYLGGMDLPEGKIKALVDDAVKRFTPRPTVLQIRSLDGVEIKWEGTCHKLVPRLIDLANLQPATKRGFMLVGPAGGGKSTTAHAIAAGVLREDGGVGVPAYLVPLGPHSSKSDLVGYMDAHGRPVWTLIREAFTNGGLLVLDEMDAAHPGVLTILNSLLAQDEYSWPDGTTTKRHPDFRYAGAANTFGMGANLVYIGRNQLDAATLDRFTRVLFAYDEELENLLAQNAAEKVKAGAGPLGIAWAKRVQALRHAADEAGIRWVISPRAAQAGAARLAFGHKQDEVENEEVWGSGACKPEDRSRILERVR